MKTNVKKGMAIAGIVLGGLGLVAGGAMLHSQLASPKIVFEEKIVTETIEVPVEKEVVKYVNQTVEVPVDNGDLEFTLCRLEDKNIIDDCTEIVAELKAEDSALKLAFESLNDRAEIFDLLEDEGIVSDEDEVRVIRVYKDFEDVNITESDFDNDSYEFEIEMKVEDLDLDVKKHVFFTVRVEDGESEILSVRE